jgi:predicted flap endonuclease-1-like 5' DNA nuclease
MVETPPRPSDRTRKTIERQTERIAEDPFNRRVEAQKDELTDIDGVGDDLSRRLKGNGFTYIRDVADEPTQNLTQIEGVGEARAEELKNAAATANSADFEELEDLDGVGNTTARKLRDAGIRDPHELRGKRQSTIAAIDGIGPKRAARIRADVEFDAPAGASNTGYGPETEQGSTVFRETRETSLQPFNDTIKTADGDGGVKPVAGTVGVSGPDRQEAIAEHAERSEEARQADESFNAPIMLDEETWARNKDEYDYPGVDTIPRSRKLDRARDVAARAKEAGFLSEVDASTEATDDWRARGKFSFGKIGVDTSFRQVEDTFAHELGHAIDEGTDRPSGANARGEVEGESIFDDQDVLEQASQVSEQRRGRELDSDYLESQNEIFADLVAETIINPRRAKKEAPDAVRALNDRVKMKIGNLK